jgi:riboflavin synthase
MFTGIVEEVGQITKVERRVDVVAIGITAQRVLAGLPVGGSVAVSGCCLTAIGVGPGGFVCELTPETLARTRFGDTLAEGLAVNLERPMRADGRFDGHIVQGHVDAVGRVVSHIVQGHVDAVGRVVSLTLLGESAELTILAPAEVLRYLVEKGSVAVEGVSLTVARQDSGTFTIALIPFTLSHTNLGGLRAGDPVNLEIDVIAKYVERLAAGPR